MTVRPWLQLYRRYRLRLPKPHLPSFMGPLRNTVCQIEDLLRPAHLRPAGIRRGTTIHHLYPRLVLCRDPLRHPLAHQCHRIE
jgi:hypothetical protein